MARKLVKKQILLLKQHPDINNVEDLSEDDWCKLIDINYYEMLWQDANRFLWDQYMGQANDR